VIDCSSFEFEKNGHACYFAIAPGFLTSVRL